MKTRKLTATSVISINDEPAVPLESLTPEQKKYICEEVSRRIRQTIADYIHLHPEEAEQIKQALPASYAKQIWKKRQ